MILVTITCTQRERKPCGRNEEVWLPEPMVRRVGAVTVECAGEDGREGVWAEAVNMPESWASSGDGEDVRNGEREVERVTATSLTREACGRTGYHLAHT